MCRYLPRPAVADHGGNVCLSLGGVSQHLFVFGITLNTLAMGYYNSPNLRKGILLTSTLILIYNLLIPSIGGNR
ncbi:MAG: YgjV family protein [Clostridia bacterium]|nr:YgjV family protein [Clostridia bacterium]